jgi:hypothetical protein
MREPIPQQQSKSAHQAPASGRDRHFLGLTALACCAACALVLAVWGIHAARSYAQSNNGQGSSQSHVPPWVQLDNAAVAARAGDEPSIKALAMEVLNQPHGFPQAPPEAVTPILNRLVHAEMRYRSGQGGPVDENSIVPMVNDVAQKLGLPKWATVDSPEVRQMHMRALAFSPVFMGQGAVHAKMRVGDGIDSKMSPLQAFHLAMFVMGQKANNPDDQFAPGEWEGHQAELQTQRVQEFQEGWQPAGKKHRPYLVVIQDLKTTQMATAIQNAAATMTVEDALTLANRELDTLGVEPQGGGQDNE